MCLSMSFNKILWYTFWLLSEVKLLVINSCWEGCISYKLEYGVRELMNENEHELKTFSIVHVLHGKKHDYHSKEKYIIFTTLYVTIFSIIVTWSLLINLFYRLFALEKHNDYGLPSNYSSNQYFPHCQNILKYIWLLSQLIQSFFTNVV